MKTVFNLLTSIILLNILFCTGIAAQQWNSLSDSPNDLVSAFVVDSSNNSLVVGGAFVYTGPMQNWFIAGWNGSNWFQIGTGNNFVGGGMGIASLDIYNSQLYAGGDFNAPANLVTGWNGSSWFALNNYLYAGTYPSGNPEIKAIKSFNNKLYITGSFRYKDYITIPDTVNSLLTWNGLQCEKLADSSGIKVGLSYYPPNWGFIGRALHVFNNELYIAGVFDTICGVASPSKVAKTDGQSWFPVGNLLATDPYCLQDYDNSLFAGGQGQQILRYDGSSWIPFATIAGQNPVVYAMTQYNGDLVIAGYFDSVNNIAAKNIARWDGSSWSPFSSGLTNNLLTGNVYALTVFQGDLYAGGAFTLAGGNPALNIARWSEPTGIGETSLRNELYIYPNPSSTYLHIQKSDIETFTNVLVFNSYGTIVKNISTNKIYIGDLAPGIYFLQMIDDNGVVYNQKFIKN